MRSVNLKMAGEFHLERCGECFGLFFDAGELETVLDDSVKPAHEINLERLNQILEEESVADHGSDVVYLSCPVCAKLMHRKSYGARSGVIVDTCKEHGAWLDGGELRQLMKWLEAGGKQHTGARLAEERREQERRKRTPSALDTRLARMDPQSGGSRKGLGSHDDDGLLGVLEFVRRVIR